jgi:membrane protein DedA with SNARE-associated domain
MDINSLIEHYGYAALVVGSIAEGETITLLGGVATHQGLLKFPLVIAAVALGGMTGDQVLYFIGQRFGVSLLKRFTRHQKHIARARKMINRHPWLFVIGVRFMYGFRIVGPVLIGASRLPPGIFLPLNILGAILWATLFSTLGYAGGELIAPWLHSVDKHIKQLIWLALAVALVAAARYWLKRRARHNSKENRSGR